MLLNIFIMLHIVCNMLLNINYTLHNVCNRLHNTGDYLHNMVVKVHDMYYRLHNVCDCCLNLFVDSCTMISSYRGMFVFCKDTGKEVRKQQNRILNVFAFRFTYFRIYSQNATYVQKNSGLGCNYKVSLKVNNNAQRKFANYEN